MAMKRLFPKTCLNINFKICWTSLVGQWLRICLPMQRTWVWSLVWEGSTCHGATRSMHPNYWACKPRAHGPQQEKPLKRETCTPLQVSSPCSPQQEQSPHEQKKTQGNQNLTNKYVKMCLHHIKLQTTPKLTLLSSIFCSLSKWFFYM